MGGGDVAVAKRFKKYMTHDQTRRQLKSWLGLL